ncbi:MAG: hypothetical protein ACK41O_16200 [Runella zeae]
MLQFECKIHLKNKVIKRIIEAPKLRVAFQEICKEADSYGECALSVSARKINP